MATDRADAMNALTKERDELAAELTAFENEVYKREADFAFKMGKLEARAEQAEAEVERLRSALHVFASAADGRRRKDWLGGVCFQQDVLLSAREALQRKEGNE